MIIAVDVRLTAGEAWGTPPDVSAVESLFVVAASLARSLGLERVPFGLASAGLQGGGYRIAWLPVAEGPGQAARAFDLLARAASDPLAPFGDVVRWVGRFAKPGSTVVVVTGRIRPPTSQTFTGWSGPGVRHSSSLVGVTARQMPAAPERRDWRPGALASTGHGRRPVSW